jgi:hypothetical protein
MKKKTKKQRPKQKPKQKRTSARGTAGTDATWSSSAASGVWNTAANWSPATVPTDAATFGASNQTGITFAGGSSASVDNIEFEGGAASYTLTFTETSPATPTLTISGGGVSNASSNAQVLEVAAFSASRDTPQLAFTNSANAGGSGMQYKAGPTDPSGQGGGVIRFYDTSTAGSASFEVTTGSGTPPHQGSTVGGEVTFSETASAGTASFNVYGSTSTTDGDTFGNVVFHDSASAANATFTNIGATEPSGDGGNTQFYDTSTAGNGIFHNQGASVAGGYGGDVAFDSIATASHGHFHNYASTAGKGSGGVTSFNNNCPQMPSTQGASAGKGFFYNYGAGATGQGGGHVFFQSKYGSPTAADGLFVNCGSAVSGSSSAAGRTVFSISLPQLDAFTPTAGNAAFLNAAGTSAGAPGGLTEFTVNTFENTTPCTSTAAKARKGAKPGKATAVNSVGPNAGNALLVNVGATVQGAYGGQTSFGGAQPSGSTQWVVSSAANATILATAGTNGGYGGRIVFYDGSSGGSATIGLSGNATLDVSGAGQSITVGAMNLTGGIIACSLGTQTTNVNVTGNVSITGSVTFSFNAGGGFLTGNAYTILTAANLNGYLASQFLGNAIGQAKPTFSIVNNSLVVTFSSSGAKERPPRSRTRA